MTVGDHKLRIALAVFENAAALEPAISALLAEGVELVRMGLILSAATAEQLAHRIAPRLAEPPARSLADLIDALTPLSAASDAPPIVASPPVIRPWASGWRFPTLWGLQITDTDEPRLAPDLDRQVRAGAAILTVESLSLREQWLCTRVLLAQSTSTVLALECSLPPSAP